MDWKERCFQLEQQHAAELTRAEESESRLSRTLVQLTLAVGGLDPVLDPHLKSLREAVRDTSGVDTDARLSKITDALIKSGNTSQSPLHTPPINSIDLFHRIRQRIQQQSSSAERLKLLAQEMVSNPATMTDNQLDELLKLLISDKPSSSGKGLLGALLPSTEALSDDKEKVGSNQQLLILLEQQSWPGQLTKEIAELEADLDGGAAEGAWLV